MYKNHYHAKNPEKSELNESGSQQMIMRQEDRDLSKIFKQLI